MVWDVFRGEISLIFKIYLLLGAAGKGTNTRVYLSEALIVVGQADIDDFVGAGGAGEVDRQALHLGEGIMRGTPFE